MKKIIVALLALFVVLITVPLLATAFMPFMVDGNSNTPSVPISPLKDTTDVDYFEIDPYSIADDTNLDNLNDAGLIKLVQSLGYVGTEAEMFIDVWFPATNLPSTMDSLLFIFRTLPWESSSSSFEQLDLVIYLYQFVSTWHYVKIFNATTTDLDFKYQDTSSEVDLTGLDKTDINDGGYVKFRFTFTATYASSTSIDLYFFFNYLKLVGGNNIEFVKMYPSSTSFTGASGESVEIDGVPQTMYPDGAGQYQFYGSQKAVMGLEDDETVDFHLEPLEGKTSLTFDISFSLDDYIFDDIHACILYHHEFLERSYTGSFSGFELDYHDGSDWNFLTYGNTYDDDPPSMYPTENLQGMLLPVPLAVLASGELTVQYRVNFVVTAPDPEDFIAIDLDACYLLLVRPLRPVVEFTPTEASTQIFENYTVTMQEHSINGSYPHPITKLEVFKEGAYQELSVSQGTSDLEFQFTKNGTQSFHFKVTFGADYYCTEDFTVQVTLRNYHCLLNLVDFPNTLQLSLTVSDQLNRSTRPNIPVSIIIYHHESEGWTTIHEQVHLTNGNGKVHLELDITGSYYLHQYYASITINPSLYYNGIMMPTPIITCTNCTPEITLTDHQDPPELDVLELASVDFHVETLQPVNRSWIMYDGKMLCEITAVEGANHVEFHGIKGTHVYQVRVENILGQTSSSESFTMTLNAAPATLHSSYSMVGDTLQVTYYVEDDLGAKIAVPVKIEVWDHGVLVISMVLDSSTTSVSTCHLTFDVFSSHAFEVFLMVNDTRYDSNPVTLTASHAAIPIGSIVIEACGSCALIGIGAVYFIRKRRGL